MSRELDVAALPLVGPHLVEASAGCGKTHALRDLYVRLLLDRAIPVTDILVITYTKAATAELQTRIRVHLQRLLQDTHVDEKHRRLVATALRDFDRAPIFTIHGFCQRVLAEHAFESAAGFQTELREDITSLVEEVVADFWTTELRDAALPLLTYLDRVAKTRPADLVRLAKRVLQDPSAPILPAESASLETEPLIDAWRNARDSAGRVWRSDRDEIITLLAKDSGLNRQTYRPQYVTDALPRAMDLLFDARMLPTTNDDIRKVASGHLRVKRNHEPPKHRFFDACRDLLDEDARLRSAFTEASVQLRVRFAHYARTVVPARLAAHDHQTFDDLLVHLARALDGPAGAALAGRLRNRYPAALIDEFQDTDPTQYAIVRRIYGGTESPVFLIGDPKQAIYGFRGADVFAYLEAARSENTERSTLSTNWRTDPSLLKAVDAVFCGARNPFVIDRLSYSGVDARPDAVDQWDGPPLTFLTVRRSEIEQGDRKPRRIPRTWDELPRRIASHLAAALSSSYRDDSPVLPSHHGVLCRTNAQALAIQRALRELGIPSVLDAGASVFDSEEADELSRTLRAMASPYDPRTVRSALATDLVGLRATELERLRHDEAMLEEWLERFRVWGERWRTDGVLQAFRAFVEEWDIYSRLLSLPSGERRLTNLLHLTELLHVASREQHLGPMALIRWLMQMRRSSDARAEMATDAMQMRLESDDDAVKLTTIHKSKGLEYPIVYCPFLWDRGPSVTREGEPLLFHDPSGNHRRTIDLGSSQWAEHRQLADHEAFAEAVRLTYVALTRAKHACYVVWGAFSGYEESALAYLLHQGSPSTTGDKDHTVDGVLGRVKDLTDEDIEADLRRLGESTSTGVERLTDRVRSRWCGPNRPPIVGSRRWKRRELVTTRMTSFSGLVEKPRADHAADLGRDRDEHAETSFLTGSPSADPVALADFPAGPGPGNLIHSIFEKIDFRDPATLSARVVAALHEHGVDEGQGPQIVAALSDVLETPLPSGGSLSEISSAERLVELEFLVSAGKEHPVSAANLAHLLDRHQYPTSDPTYPSHLARLGFEPLRGFLRGFVDLVMRQGDSFWVVDYKTNHLGRTGDDYRPASLRAPMRSHHYHLQGLIYSLAVSRYLSRRVSLGNDSAWAESQWGGVMFLFIRGMNPAGADQGISFERPTPELLEDLDRLFGGDGQLFSKKGAGGARGRASDGVRK